MISPGWAGWMVSDDNGDHLRTHTHTHQIIVINFAIFGGGARNVTKRLKGTF